MRCGLGPATRQDWQGVICWMCTEAVTVALETLKHKGFFFFHMYLLFLSINISPGALCHMRYLFYHCYDPHHDTFGYLWTIVDSVFSCQNKLVLSFLKVSFSLLEYVNVLFYCWCLYLILSFVGDKCDVALEVLVDKRTAAQLNSGADKLYDILVLHLEGGKDLFITITGTFYICWMKRSEYMHCLRTVKDNVTHCWKCHNIHKCSSVWLVFSSSSGSSINNFFFAK